MAIHRASIHLLRLSQSLSTGLGTYQFPQDKFDHAIFPLKKVFYERGYTNIYDLIPDSTPVLPEEATDERPGGHITLNSWSYE